MRSTDATLVAPAELAHDQLGWACVSDMKKVRLGSARLEYILY